MHHDVTAEQAFQRNGSSCFGKKKCSEIPKVFKECGQCCFFVLFPKTLEQFHGIQKCEYPTTTEPGTKSFRRYKNNIVLETTSKYPKVANKLQKRFSSTTQCRFSFTSNTVLYSRTSIDPDVGTNSIQRTTWEMLLPPRFREQVAVLQKRNAKLL